MSFDLTFWFEGSVPSPEEAYRTWDRLTDFEENVVLPHPAVDAFYGEVVATFGDVGERSIDDTPWAARLDRFPAFVTAPVAWSRAQEVAPVLLELAGKHGLIAFDPQQREVHYPGGEVVQVEEQEQPADE